MTDSLLTAFALMLVIEGLMPFLVPGAWRDTFRAGTVLSAVMLGVSVFGAFSAGADDTLDDTGRAAMSDAQEAAAAAQQALGDCIIETADYLRVRAAFYEKEVDYETTYQRMMEQQITVHEKQNLVRELLFKSRNIF